MAASNLDLRESGSGATDWNRYHQHAPALAKLTRRYTRSVLLRALHSHAAKVRNGVIVELGGGNSFFAAEIIQRFAPREYHVVDTNDAGLRMLGERSTQPPLVFHKADVLTMSLPLAADAVFSIGLIEHFAAAARRRAILAHVDTVRPGGCVAISFPIATLTYRMTRALAELSGSWLFPDETPVDPAEVTGTLAGQAQIVAEHTLWPLVLTQKMIVARRK